MAELSADEPRPGASLAGNYWTWRGSGKRAGEFLVFDRGAVCAPHLPAHGHCDLLNVTGWVGGRPWLIDSGNFDYEAGSMRQYCRSSIAHNVVTVEDRNQCEIWSRFRMGRRGRVVDSAEGEVSGLAWSMAAHDSWRHTGVPEMQRWIAVDTGRPVWICLELATAKVARTLTAFLHLAPGLRITPIGREDRSSTLEIDDGRCRARLTLLGVDSSELLTGWSCPAFGVRHPAPVVEYRKCGDLSAPFGWILDMSGSDESAAWQILVGRLRSVLPESVSQRIPLET
jgi:hypothetical protein